MEQEMPTKRILGHLAQAIDELPEGETGFAAAKAVLEFLGGAGYTITPVSAPEHRVLAAAREWLTERQPRDNAEKALFAAVLRAYPEDADTRETCDCGEECDECPTAAQVEAMIQACEAAA